MNAAFTERVIASHTYFLYPLLRRPHIKARLVFTSCSSTSTIEGFSGMPCAQPFLDFPMAILDFFYISVCAYGPAVSCSFMEIGGAFTYAN